MSSGIEAGGAVIAAAVVAPAVVALGAGWLAWQSGKILIGGSGKLLVGGGKLLLEANRTADRKIADVKRRQEEEERHKKTTAVAAYRKLVEMCDDIYLKLDGESEALKKDLDEIRNQSIPDDIVKLESMISLGYLKLDGIIREQKRIAELKLSETMDGASVSEVMEGLRVSVGAMTFAAASGDDVVAADPVVLERMELNEKFADVTGRVMDALEYVTGLESEYGLTASGSIWFHSCCNGIDTRIESLCSPSISNAELKKGIRRLEDLLEQYDVMLPTIEKEIGEMLALYEVYEEVADALGEDIESMNAFNGPDEIKPKLKEFEEKAERAKECAELYKAMGEAAYICCAWDQELKAMGYKVHSRDTVHEMRGKDSENATVGDIKIPFYEWNEDELTQLYSITDECSLQVIVHDDGTVSMHTIAESANEETVDTQKKHCAQLAELYERLKKNWFITYDFEETESAEKVMTVAGWRRSGDSVWNESGKKAEDVISADKKKDIKEKDIKEKDKPKQDELKKKKLP